MSGFSEYVMNAAREAGYDVDSPRGGGRKALADAAGMSSASVSRMLAGKSAIKAGFLPALASALNVDADDLYIAAGFYASGDGSVSDAARVTNEAFTSWLVKERARVGISQERLARLVTLAGFPITQQYLTKVETGLRANIPLGFAVAITAAFGATPDIALGFAPDDPDARALMPCPQCGDEPPAGFTCNTCGGAS